MFSMAHESSFPRVTVVLTIVDDNLSPLLAAERVLDQSYRNFELLIVVLSSAAEGARYGCEDVIDALVARGYHVRVHVIRFPTSTEPDSSTARVSSSKPQSEKTVITALSAGNELAQGEYVTWLDTDTRWHPDYLKEMVAALDSRPSAMAAYCDNAEYQPDERVLIRIVSHPEFLLRELTTFSPIPRGVLYRQSVLNTFRPVRFNLPPEFEEWGFLVRIAERFEAVHVSSLLVKSIVRPPAATTTSIPNPDTVDTGEENGEEGTLSKTRESIYKVLQIVFSSRANTTQPLHPKMVPLGMLYPTLADCKDQDEARFTALFDMGIRLLVAEKQSFFEDSLGYFEEALTMKPKFTSLHVYIGAVRLLQHKWRQAKKSLDMAESNLAIMELFPTIEALKEKATARDSTGIARILPILQFEESELMRRERERQLKLTISKAQLE